MSGETIKDVVFRTKISVPPNAAAPIKTIGTEVDKTKLRVGEFETKMENLRRTIAKTAEAYVQGNTAAGRSLDKLMQKEDELARKIRIRDRALGQAPMGSNGQQFLPADKPKGPGLGGMDLGGAGAMLFKSVAAPVAIVAMAPAVATAMASSFKGLAADLRGGDDAAAGGFFTPAFTALGQAIGIPAAQPSEAQKEADLVSIEEERLQSQLQNLNKQQAALVAVHEKKLKHLDEESKLLDAEGKALAAVSEAKIREYDTAAIAFGGATGEEQQQIVDVSAKIDKGGVESLNEEELKFAKSNRALFGRELDVSAIQNVQGAFGGSGAAGFAKVDDQLGFSRRSNLAEKAERDNEAAQKAIVQQQLDIEVKVDAKGFDEMIDQIQTKILAVVNKSVLNAEAAINKRADDKREKVRRGEGL